ncbi:MAG: DNA mismatch repair endonuclease MutL, partial [Desulfococcus multivorans]|nr:DNA mismatch repair endonuclease MutL [Desulfococcus multivorans]
MTTIKVLPETLSNKIAAGEVVERPASVVKELMENALDAGGTRIVVSVEKGGRALIQVADNGTGMTPDDALLSIERYATSKIYDDGDLFAIGTLGFRGEALPSIASVSRLAMETRHRSRDTGVRIEMSGGTLGKVTEIGAPVGTLVAVRDLFFNTPARRKFLKTVATEMSHISEVVSNIAVGWPQVAVTLRHDGREVKSWPVAADSAERAADVIGRTIDGDLLRVDRSADEVSVTGWIASSGVTRSTSRGIYLYVNGRCIRDRVIQNALFSGYRGRIMKGRFPVAVLFVSVPPDRVDVNVHPAKSEVRFSDPQQIHRLVETAVSSALASAGRSGKMSSPEAAAPREAPPFFQTGGASGFGAPADVRAASLEMSGPPRTAEDVAGYPVSAASPDGGEKVEQPLRNISPPVQAPVWEKRFFADLAVIGQFRDTYIICET